MDPSHIYQPVRLKKLEIRIFLTWRRHSSNPQPLTARILSYLDSAQQAITGEPQENVREQIITILTLNYTIYSLPGKYRRLDQYDPVSLKFFEEQVMRL